MQSLSTKNGVLVTPQDTTIGIYYNTKEGHIRKANIGQNNNKYFALFEEDDVDFFVRVTNSNKIGRDFRYRMTVHNEEYGFVVLYERSNDLKTIESNGRHLHFISESSRDGKQLLRKMATRLSITPDRAASIMSTLKFDVAYANRYHAISVRFNDISKPHLKATVLAMSSETILQLKDRIKRLYLKHLDEPIELYYDGTLDVIHYSTRIGNLKSEKIKIILNSSFHATALNIGVRKNDKIIFGLDVTSETSVEDLRKEIWQRAPDGLKCERDVDIHCENSTLDYGFLIDYGVRPGMILDICSGSMQIFCKLLTGTTITIDCFKSDRIIVMKRLIEQSEFIPCDQQRLIYAGRQLDDDYSFNYYNVQRESTIHLVLRLRGGNNSILSDTPAVLPPTDHNTDGEDSNKNVSANRNANKTSEVGERGLVCFGQNTDQKFTSVEFKRDSSIEFQPFSIELRLSKETTRRRSSRLMLKHSE